MKRSNRERFATYPDRDGPYGDDTKVTVFKSKIKECPTAWCSDLSLEKVENKAKDFHPDYILIWQSIIEEGTDKKYIVDDYLWFKQITLTFQMYDKVIEDDKYIVLGCYSCINRSPHTLILYYMYHGIDVLDAYEEVKKLANNELTGWPQYKEDIVKKLEYIRNKYFIL
jgi:hypothetical protein